jgi:SAM-dependent methyltransferase
MPVSTSVHISHCLSRIIQLEPASVLDVGCGFGLWGFLCREYLDVINERVQPESWRTRIDGIELFEPYILAHQRALYSSIQIADIRDVAASVDEYDLIITGDVIEHLDKADGEAVISLLYQKARLALMVNIPIGDGWEHPERHGNPGELHRSQWYVEDFLAYPNEHTAYSLPCGQYGVFYCPKTGGAALRANALLAAADHWLGRGDTARAADLARESHALDPASPESAIFLADMLIRLQRVNDAADVLERTLEVNPGFHYGYLALARIQAALSRRSAADERLRSLLAMGGVDVKLRLEAERERAKLISPQF